MANPTAAKVSIHNQRKVDQRKVDQRKIDQRVVVGVDSSPGALDALRWADQFATRTGRRLRVITSWSYPSTAALPGGPDLLGAHEMDASATEEVTHTVLTHLGRALPEGDLQVHRGPADLALLTAAQAPDAALVVVGKRGLGPIDGRLLGSVSRRVAELAHCPVAVIPALTDIGTAPAPDGPILVGVDGSEAAAAARDWAISAALELGVELIFAHGVAGLPSELPPSSVDNFIARAQVMVEAHVTAARQAGVAAGAEVAVDDPRRLLDRLSDTRRAQMIVVGAQGEGAVGGMLIGTVVHYVAQFAGVPVIIVR
jgi:nucleotide-binding universal stress UspA family protein